MAERAPSDALAFCKPRYTLAAQPLLLGSLALRDIDVSVIVEPHRGDWVAGAELLPPTKGDGALTIEQPRETT